MQHYKKEEKKHYLRKNNTSQKMTIKLKLFIISTILLLQFTTVNAQTGEIAFGFLRLPYSAHVAALGGTNISTIDDDITLAAHNPALLINVSHNTLNLNYMTYMSDSKVAGVGYSRVFGERSAGAIIARYVDYGQFEGYDENNVYTGTFKAKDMEFAATYSYLLSDYWSGGVAAKFIYSKYESMSSIALGIDLGLNYFNEDSDLSASLVFKNLGAQVKAFEDKSEKMPFDILLGVTKRLGNAPIRLSLTMNNLHKWSNDDFYNADGSKDSFSKKLLKHFTFGADVLLGERFYASIGYNYRMTKELSTSDSKWDGLSIGAGGGINKFKFGISYSKLHVSSNSLLFNVSYTL